MGKIKSKFLICLIAVSLLILCIFTGCTKNNFNAGSKGITSALQFLCAQVNTFTSQVTSQSSIKTNTILTQYSICFELLPKADAFVPYKGNLLTISPNSVYVSNCYLSTNDTGIVVSVESESYGGLLTAMVGIDNEGAITGIHVSSHNDTMGLGTKAHDANYLMQYVGVTKLSGATDIKDDPNVEAVAGATISSNALYQAAYAALSQYNSIQG